MSSSSNRAKNTVLESAAAQYKPTAQWSGSQAKHVRRLRSNSTTIPTSNNQGQVKKKCVTDKRHTEATLRGPSEARAADVQVNTQGKSESRHPTRKKKVTHRQPTCRKASAQPFVLPAWAREPSAERMRVSWLSQTRPLTMARRGNLNPGKIDFEQEGRTRGQC